MTSTARDVEQERPRPAPDDDRLGAIEQIRWFGLLWIMAMVFHHTDSHPTGAFQVLTFAAPLLVWPASSAAMLLFVGSITVTGLMGLPGIANHIVLAILVGFGFLGSALYLAVNERRFDRDFGIRWFRTLRTPVGLTMVVVYAFTTFHKLNTAFFDGVDSCAGHLTNQMLDLNGLGVHDLPPVVVLGSAVGTIIVELLIMICLAVPELRRYGLVVGVGFHGLLAWSSFYDFATAVFALYVLLAPTSAFAAVHKRAPNLRMWALIAFLGHLTLAVTTSLMDSTRSSFGLHWHTVLVLTWYLAVMPFMVLLAWYAYLGQEPFPRWRWRPAVLLLIPALAFVNGATPYLGLKTVANYSMFSNLHTEDGRTNHLLPGVLALQVFHYQDDPVTVLKMDAPDNDAAMPKWMREAPPQVVPLQELRRVIQAWRDENIGAATVEYELHGQRQLTTDAVNDPVIGAPMPFWQRKLMSFRAITSADGPDICRW